MHIKRVKIHNILSIEDIEISFGNNGLILLDGFNYDTNRHNGAGKTAIFNALSFGIYNKLPRDISASKIIRRGQKEGYVEVEIQLNDNTFLIKREKPNKITIHINNIEKNISQEELENSLKINYSQFLIAMYCSQRSTNKFLNLNDTDKKNFLLKLLNLDEFDSCKKSSDSMISKLENKRNDLNNRKRELLAKVTVYQEQKKDIDSIEDTISVLNENKSIVTKKLESIPENKYPDLSDIDLNINKLSLVLNNLSSKKTELIFLNKELSNINIKKDVKCPHCNNSVKISNDALIAIDNEEEINNFNQEQIKNKTEIEDKIKILKEDILKEKIFRDAIDNLKINKDSKMRNYNNSIIEVSNLNKNLNKIEVELESLIKKKKSQDEIDVKIKDLNLDISNIDIVINSLSDHIDIYKTISIACSPIGAQAYTIDSVIESFNEYVSEYVSIIWPTASYKLNTFKENKNGEVKSKISETLIIDGQECTIGELSGGEERAFSLAVDFALIDVLDKKFNLILNPIILDEALNDLDSYGKEIVIDLLKKISDKRQIWIIDHSNEFKASFSDIVTVEKRNKITSISRV